MMRKNVSHKKKEEPFLTSQHVNQILLPTYDALKDPFLIGFFDNNSIRKHLKETGVIKRAKRFSIKLKKDQKGVDHLVSRRTASKNKRSKSVSKVVPSKDNYELRLPQIQTERVGRTSFSGPLKKKIYYSKEHQVQ